MKLDIDFTKIPDFLKVDVKKGETGVLIAELPDYGVFTEAEDLNELFGNVNDLMYTYFDIPKKYHDEICFVPNTSAREELVKVAHSDKTKTFSHVRINTFYTEDLYKRILST